MATVCYNSQDTIEQTVRSVLEQTYDQIEYIVVDGASEDNTVDIIRSLDKSNRIKLISEPDNGLYDAMNKAAYLATGDYIIYMNSGDRFADRDVLAKAAKHMDGKSDLVYGNVIRIKDKGRILEKYGNKHTPMFLLLQGKMMCHQSMFTGCDVMRKYRFNTDYSITADYDFLMRMVRDRRDLKYMDIIVSVVDNVEGISSSVSNMDSMRMQDDRSLRENFPIYYYIMVLPKGIIRSLRRIKERRQIEYEYR